MSNVDEKTTTSKTPFVPKLDGRPENYEEFMTKIKQAIVECEGLRKYDIRAFEICSDCHHWPVIVQHGHPTNMHSFAKSVKVAHYLESNIDLEIKVLPTELSAWIKKHQTEHQTTIDDTKPLWFDIGYFARYQRLPRDESKWETFQGPFTLVCEFFQGASCDCEALPPLEDSGEEDQRDILRPFTNLREDVDIRL